MRQQVLSGISPRFRGLSRSGGQVTHVLLTRSPLEYPRRGLSARLACVKHAASVRPEPGSNSPTKTHKTIPAKQTILPEPKTIPAPGHQITPCRDIKKQTHTPDQPKPPDQSRGHFNATHAAPPRQLREPTGVMSSGVGETERYPMPAGAANPGVPSVTLASTASVPPRFPRGRSARRPEVSGAPAGRSIRRRPVSRSARSTGPRGNAPRPSGAGAEDAPGEIARLAAVDPVAQA